MAKLPAKVKIGAINMHIKYVARDVINADADFLRKTMQCRVDKELCQEQKLGAIIHESLHAMFSERCLGYRIKTKDEEFIVAGLEPAIHAWIKDNPSLIKAIMNAG